jgi:hypothetical protein
MMFQYFYFKIIISHTYINFLTNFYITINRLLYLLYIPFVYYVWFYSLLFIIHMFIIFKFYITLIMSSHGGNCPINQLFQYFYFKMIVSQTDTHNIKIVYD